MSVSNASQSSARLVTKAGKNESRLAAIIALVIGASVTQNDGPAAVSISLFIAAGVLLGLGRYVITDVAADTVERWWRLYSFIPIFRVYRHRLSDFSGIQLRRELRKSRSKRSKTYEVYAVNLKGDTTALVSEWKNYLDARSTAEALAQAVRLPIHDKFSGVTSTRKHDELNFSLRERLRQEGASSAMPTLDDSSTLRLQDRGSTKVLTLKAQPTGWPVIIGSQLMSAIFVAIGIVMIQANKGGGWLFGGAGALTAVVFLYNGIVSRFPLTITITADSIRCRQTFFFRRHISVDEVEEIVLGRQHLYLIGDKKWLAIPYDLEDETGKKVGGFIRDLIRYMIVNYGDERPR